MTQEKSYKTLAECLENGVLVDVPGNILDLVVAEAQKYFKNEQARLLGAYSEEAKAEIREISTHKIFDDLSSEAYSARRELHREIILQMVGGKKSSADKKPTVILFAGPPGAGKSALRKRFEQVEPFEDAHLEDARKIYQSQQGSVVSIDFGAVLDN